MPKIQSSSYSAIEKLRVLQYAKNHDQRATARGSRRICAGRKAQYLEASLNLWLIELQNDGIAVTSKMAKFYIKEILIIRESAQVYPNGKNFLASERWLYGEWIFIKPEVSPEIKTIFLENVKDKFADERIKKKSVDKPIDEEEVVNLIKKWIVGDDLEEEKEENKVETSKKKNLKKDNIPTDGVVEVINKYRVDEK
ncbi:uncharacterized protein OCT59_025607 [Rhizophagus irregularis]|uniref:HTH CENPB-type domain-containing protein n=1 Tax=Rhizophagus irregularis (strain DAOM 181602 / DAOM 197198 / MUCL 43194) TaxID=747089 RepID=A0A2P4QYX6_RHIID|nr:hypothetical protein GLOIN_2v1761727 [Rhizophagus irregularis DAOM 181602=DAOM 197198]POG82802.1 hypothetical protein GLOIN_2v1761727 [Rhizophagus irregularis DAOM 181602=DAOM 197198]UZO05248.1 hypothetical protein OCT59_025607 [Rhizophagus irregularis]|eukprot:XP_025189668.1 hypothetical protein GLOIN_2v1761727 [Rhizophagus irregularis DAOM 181602=DAOM 197198]